MENKSINKWILIFVILFVFWMFLRATPYFLGFGPFGFLPQMIMSIKHGNFMEFTSGHFFHPANTTFMVSLIMMLLWIFVVVWVYRDAEKRKMSGLLWALLVFIGNILGLIIYLIVRSSNGSGETKASTLSLCPGCGQEVKAGYAFCPYCGSKMQAECPKCKEIVAEGWKVCPHCGEKLPEGKKTQNPAGQK
jgi:RNA polymerase subunit RPABC4/transcription elongation factor Spt4